MGKVRNISNYKKLKGAQLAKQSIGNGTGIDQHNTREK